MSVADAPPSASAPAIVLMGVAGSGKTVTGEALAKRLGFRFLDGDYLHPRANVAKMASGVPLTDDDRWPWLDAIGHAIAAEENGVVVACSALKRAYRERLTAAAGKPLAFILLDGSEATLAERLGRRKGHFMPPSLLKSQLATLERPGTGERAAIVSVETSVAEVVEAAVAALARLGALTPRLSAG
ncbi:MAG TPA: gluconokinase [Bauldia sp.]|nr:gluconokinase [Bauldia sp.]